MFIGYYQTVIADGKIYGRQSDASTTTGREATQARFSCWDALTGKEIWGINNAAAWPIIAYGVLYLTDGGVTYAFSTPKDWAMWRGNVEMPGVASGTGPLNLGDGPKWTFQTGGSISAQPAVADGKMYIPSGDGKMYCLDAYDGSLVWSTDLADPSAMPFFGSTPAIVDNKVITGADDGNIYCLDANNGNILWQINAGPYQMWQTGSGQAQTTSSPIVYQNKIYVSSAHNQKTYCLDLAGNIVWSYDTDSPVFRSSDLRDLCPRYYRINICWRKLHWNNL
jgi:outer membrane protein assembly factor BamB